MGPEPNLTADSIVIRSDQAVCRVVDGEAVVVEPMNGMVNVFNAVGTRVWELLDGARPVSAIAALIAAEFDVAPDAALADTLDFLRDLDQKGLVIGH